MFHVLSSTVWALSTDAFISHPVNILNIVALLCYQYSVLWEVVKKGVGTAESRGQSYYWNFRKVSCNIWKSELALEGNFYHYGHHGLSQTWSFYRIAGIFSAALSTSRFPNRYSLRAQAILLRLYNAHWAPYLLLFRSHPKDAWVCHVYGRLSVLHCWVLGIVADTKTQTIHSIWSRLRIKQAIMTAESVWP